MPSDDLENALNSYDKTEVNQVVGNETPEQISLRMKNEIVKLDIAKKTLTEMYLPDAEDQAEKLKKVNERLNDLSKFR